MRFMNYSQALQIQLNINFIIKFEMKRMKRMLFQEEERKCVDNQAILKAKKGDEVGQTFQQYRKNKRNLNEVVHHSKKKTKAKTSTLDSFVVKKVALDRQKAIKEGLLDQSLFQLSVEELQKMEKELIEENQKEVKSITQDKFLPETNICIEWNRKFYEVKRQKKQEINKNHGEYRINQKGEFVYVPPVDHQENARLLRKATRKLEDLYEQKHRKKVTPQWYKKFRKNANGTSEEENAINDHIGDVKRRIEYIEGLLKTSKKTCDIYKLKYKLAWKEKNCFFAKQNWPIYENRYLVLELIGTGGFGQVYRVFDVVKCEEVAMKLVMIKCASDIQQSSDSNKLKHIQRQIDTHKKLNHPKIAMYYDTYYIQNVQEVDMIIVSTMQICPGQDLNEYLKENQHLSEKQAKEIIKQILEALIYLDSLEKKVIHYDLKPHNILYFNGNIKIIDFGLCKTLEQNTDQIELTSVGCGTMYYLPPESFDTVFTNNEGQKEFANSNKKKMVSTSIDMWSLGVIFYELLYGERPFGKGMSQEQVFRSGIIKQVKNAEFPRINNRTISALTKDFISKCFEDQSTRMTAKEGLLHPCFKTK